MWLIALAPVFGWAAPTPFARVIPWQYSPTWLFDQAQGKTPDHVVATFIGRIRGGDAEGANALTTTHDTAGALGLLGRAWQPPPADIQVKVDRYDEVAGTVIVRWRDREPREVRACTTRFPEGWRIDRFTSRPTCEDPT